MGDAARVDESGEAYGTFKETLKVATNKDGRVSATYETSDAYSRGGSVTVTGKGGAVAVGNLTNYNTVTLDKANAKDIRNSTAQKLNRKYSKTFASVEDYGQVESFDMAFGDVNNAVLLAALTQYSASGSVTLKNDATAGNISGYNKVTAKAKDGDSLQIGAISAFVGKVEDQDVNAGSYKEQISYNTKKNVKTVTETVAPAASVTLDDYVVGGNVEGYKTVTLTEADVNGSIVRGDSYTSKTVTNYKEDGTVASESTSVTYKRDGSVKAKDAVISGNIEDYSSVTLTEAVVTGDITQSFVAKVVDGKETIKLVGTVTLTESKVAGTIENYSAVNAKSSVIGSISNVAKVAFNSGDNELASYTGTSDNDSMTVAKKAVLELGTANFAEGNDKLTVSGTLILTGSDFKLGDNVTLAGKGEIAMTSSVYEAIGSAIGDNFAGKVLDLGATTDGFRGTAYELADNTANKAVKLDDDELYTGWLGDVADCSDTIDYIKFTDDCDEVVLSSSSFGDAVIKLGNEVLTLDGSEYKFSVSEGDVLSIERKDKSSMSYTISTLA